MAITGRFWNDCGTTSFTTSSSSSSEYPWFEEPSIERVCKLDTILNFWNKEDYKTIFISKKKCREFPQLNWMLYEIHSPYFTRDYGRHAVFRALVYRDKVVFHEIFNISRRDGEHISGVSVDGELTAAEQTRIYRYLMRKEKNKR